jgi:hypothetical protein
VVVDTGRVLGHGGVGDVGAAGVDGRGGLDNLVVAGLGNGHDLAVDDCLGHGAVRLARGVGGRDCRRLADAGCNAAVGNGDVGRSVVRLLDGNGRRVGHGDVAGGDGVDTGDIVGSHSRLGSAVGEGLGVRRPLSVGVLLDGDALLVLVVLALGVSSVSGDAVGADVVVGGLVDLLVQLLPRLGSVGGVGSSVVASGLSVTLNRSGHGVGDGLLGRVDGQVLVGSGDGNLVAVDVSDDSGDGLVLLPFAVDEGGDRLVLGGNRDGRGAVTRVNGRVSDLGRGRSRGVAVLGSDCGRKDDSGGGLHCDWVLRY